MEAALRSILKDTLGEYIKKQCLDKADMSTFPLVLRDLQLNEKKVQEEWDEMHDSAIQLTVGKIGMVKVTPSWMGTIDVLATNIELSFSFSPTQALKNQMKPSVQADEGYDQQEAAAQGPPPMCPPRFCCAHDTSDKRVKCDPHYKECKSCGITLQSSYKDFQFCPPCSDKEQRCMICGTNAPKASHYEPASAQAPPPTCPPRFCGAHDSSDKRVKGDPCFKDCKSCGLRLQSSYQDFQLCPPCSEKEQKCMICSTNAPKSCSHMPGAPQDRPQAPTSGHGGKHQAPPPPPPSQQPWDNAPNRLPYGDASAPADSSQSMYMSHSMAHASTRPAVGHAQNGSHYAGGNGQQFQTQLPPTQSERSSRQQPPGAWEQSRGGMAARPNTQNMPGHDNHEEGFSGFLRLVASDIWKTCSHDNHRAWEAQPPNRGQFQGGQHGMQQFQEGGQHGMQQFQGGVTRGGA